MSHVVISSFENVDTGDLQSEGEAIAVFGSETSARAHFASRSLAIKAAVGVARGSDPQATFITWLVLLKMPLEISNVEEALEDLELVIEETGTIDDPFGELVLAYEGFRYGPDGAVDYAQADALRGLEAWLT